MTNQKTKAVLLGMGEVVNLSPRIPRRRGRHPVTLKIENMSGGVRGDIRRLALDVALVVSDHNRAVDRVIVESGNQALPSVTASAS